jgi:hypothetical protein
MGILSAKPLGDEEEEQKDTAHRIGSEPSIHLMP